MSLSKWHLIFLLAIVVALTTQAQSEPPMKSEELKSSTQGALILPNPEVPSPSPAPPIVSSDFQKFGLHLGLGLPHPYFGGLDYLSGNKMWSASLDAGAFGAKVDNVTVSLTHYEAAVRFHPWAGSFFMGMAAGQQSLKAKSSDSTIVSGQTVTAEANVTSTYYTPQLGWHWSWNSGFQLGFELGAQLSGSSKTDFSSNASSFGVTESNSTDYAKLAKDARDKGDQIGKATLPYLTLLRLGWLF